MNCTTILYIINIDFILVWSQNFWSYLVSGYNFYNSVHIWCPLTLPKPLCIKMRPSLLAIATFNNHLWFLSTVLVGVALYGKLLTDISPDFGNPRLFVYFYMKSNLWGKSQYRNNLFSNTAVIFCLILCAPHPSSRLFLSPHPHLSFYSWVT